MPKRRYTDSELEYQANETWHYWEDSGGYTYQDRRKLLELLFLKLWEEIDEIQHNKSVMDEKFSEWERLGNLER